MKLQTLLIALKCSFQSFFQGVRQTVLVLTLSNTFLSAHKRTYSAGKRKRSCEQGTRLWREKNWKMTDAPEKKKTTLLGNETYRILADLHYCRQTAKRRNNRENEYNWTALRDRLTGKTVSSTQMGLNIG